jgi:hypothetical protein
MHQTADSALFQKHVKKQKLALYYKNVSFYKNYQILLVRNVKEDFLQINR